VLEHRWDGCPDFRRDLSPGCVGAEGEWLGSRGAEGCGEEGHRTDVGVCHDLRVLLARDGQKGMWANLIFFTGEVAKLDAPLYASITLVGRSGLKKSQPIVHKLLRIGPRRSKIDQLDLSSTLVSVLFVKPMNLAPTCRVF